MDEIRTIFKTILKRLKNIEYEEIGYEADELSEHLKDTSEKLKQQCNYTNKETVNASYIKKQIKHSNNPLEIKMLNKKLNEFYKTCARSNNS